MIIHFLIIQGDKDETTNWEISVILNISERTVKYHLAKLMEKLNAQNRYHIVARGLKNIGSVYH